MAAAESEIAVPRWLPFEIEMMAVVRMRALLHLPQKALSHTHRNIQSHPDCQCRSDNIES